MSVTHGSFVIEKSLPATPDRVFRAYSDQAAKSRWFADPAQVGTSEWLFDFRVGGREVNHFGYSDKQVEGTPLPKGTTGTFNAVYFDIIADQRIVFAYDMIINGQRISVSLQSVELVAQDSGTLLRLTEHGTFLEGGDGPEIREMGTRQLLDALAGSLQTEAVTA
jgi:uncharacterized protein YndB with AHSA1/START domain